MDKHPEVKKSEKIFEHYRCSERGTWGKQIAEDRGFVASVQIEESHAKALEAKNQPVLCINEVTPARDQAVSQLTENSPRFMSYGRENSDPTTASHVSDLMEYIWYVSDGDTCNTAATQDFEDTGMWAMMAYYDPYADYGQGEIFITDVNPAEIYLDPHTKKISGDDSPHILIAKKMTDGYIKVTYPDFSFDGAEQCYDDDEQETDRRKEEDQILKVGDNPENKYYRVIDRYTKIKEVRYHIIDRNVEKLLTYEDYSQYWLEPAIILTRANGEDYITDPADVQEWQQTLAQYGDIIHYVNNTYVDGQGQYHEDLQIVSGFEAEGAIPGSTTKIRQVNKGYLIDIGIIEKYEPKVDRIKRVLSIGGKLYYQGVMPISHYPIQLTMLHTQRNPFPMGDVRLVKPLQQQLNKIDSLIIAYNTNITNVKAFLPEGTKNKKDLEDRWGKAGAELFYYDDETGGVPIIVQLTQMSNALYEQRNILIAQIQRIMGAYPFLDGDASQAPDTYRATLVVQEEGQKRARSKRKKIENAINRLAFVVSEMMPAYFKERKAIRILKPNHEVKEVVFNEVSYEKCAREVLNDLSVGRYDIVMVSGSMLPTNRWARSEYYTGLFEKGILQDASVILRESEIPNVENVIAKQDALMRAEQMIKQLDETVKNLEGDLQTASRAEVSSRKRVEVAKFQAELDKVMNEIKATTELWSQRIKDIETQKTQKADKQQSNKPKS